MNTFTSTVAIAAIAAVSAAPVLAQDTTQPTSDPFVSTQGEVGAGAGLSGAVIGGITLVVIGGVLVAVDSDGNVVSTTATP
ncbi:MAG: hypothetical protein AAGL23_12840 [Pseudomonadota bacterium]